MTGIAVSSICSPGQWGIPDSQPFCGNKPAFENVPEQISTFPDLNRTGNAQITKSAPSAVLEVTRRDERRRDLVKIARPDDVVASWPVLVPVGPRARKNATLVPARIVGNGDQGTVSEAIMPPSKVLSSCALSTIAEV